MKKLLHKTLLVAFLCAAVFTPLTFAKAQTDANSPISPALQTEMDNQRFAFQYASGLGAQSPAVVISWIIKAILGLLGVIFIVLIIYAGFLWMTSAGNEDAIGKAKKTIVAAIIGLAIVLFAYMITIFVIDQLLIASTGDPSGIN